MLLAKCWQLGSAEAVKRWTIYDPCGKAQKLILGATGLANFVCCHWSFNGSVHKPTIVDRIWTAQIGVIYILRRRPRTDAGFC